MATVYQVLYPENVAMVGTVFPDYRVVQGTNFPVTALYYGNGTNPRAAWKFKAVNYGSGNITLDIEWYAPTITTGTVLFTAQLAAITPDTDATDIEAKALAAANTVTDTNLGAPAKRLHTASITITNLDGITANDEAYIILERTGSDNTLGEAIAITKCTISYSDV